ncbi:PQQ-binding-like beta-propeller repeat protein [Muricauda sp. ANG21]|uniref:PQQ-binding-like beta-propeller repeat protein n=1 Tax=Allomuricauda sp. ANG21 TaxID=3042468 RepID=UPI0034528447
MNFTFFTAMAVFFLTNVAFGQTENWKFKTNGRVYASPVIDEDVIFFGSGDSTVYAVDRHTAKLKWKYKTMGEVHSSPFIKANTLFVGSSDGILYAINKLNGELKWKFRSAGEVQYDMWDYYLSSPIVYGENVFWGSGDGNLYCLNIKGEVTWKFKTDDVVHATPIISDGNVYIGSFDGFFYCLNAKDGSLKWKFDTIGDTFFPKGEVQRGAVVHEGIVYFGSRDYNIYAIDAETGHGRWNFKHPGGWVVATPLMVENKLFVGTSDGHIFYCFDKDYGGHIWDKKLNMRVYGGAIEHEGVVYFGTFDGKVLGLHKETGKEKWVFQTEASKKNYSKIFDSSGNFKEGFELYGDDIVKSESMIHTLGSILSTPSIKDNKIYFGSSDGYLYAINLKDNNHK